MTATGLPALQHLGKSLKEILSAPPVDHPLLLTPHSPYAVGRAALVFVSQHVLDPAGNLAEFGWETIDPTFGDFVHHPPHGGAHVVAWFRPPSVGRKYNVNFSCEALRGHSLVLSSAGDTETISISTEDLDTPEALPLTK